MTYPAAYKKAKKKAVAKKRATVKRRRNPTKKKRTAKQIAATKKLIAFNKKRKKNPAKKVTKRTVTKRKPIKRKSNPVRKRRVSKWRVLCVVPSVRGLKEGNLKDNETLYFSGLGWGTRKSQAIRFPSVQAAKNMVAILPVKYRSGPWWSYATEVV